MTVIKILNILCIKIHLQCSLNCEKKQSQHVILRVIYTVKIHKQILFKVSTCFKCFNVSQLVYKSDDVLHKKGYTFHFTQERAILN